MLPFGGPSSPQAFDKSPPRLHAIPASRWIKRSSLPAQGADREQVFMNRGQSTFRYRGHANRYRAAIGDMGRYWGHATFPSILPCSAWTGGNPPWKKTSHHPCLTLNRALRSPSPRRGRGASISEWRLNQTYPAMESPMLARCTFQTPRPLDSSCVTFPNRFSRTYKRNSPKFFTPIRAYTSDGSPFAKCHPAPPTQTLIAGQSARPLFLTCAPSCPCFDVSIFRLFDVFSPCPNTCPPRVLAHFPRALCHLMSPSILQDLRASSALVFTLGPLAPGSLGPFLHLMSPLKSFAADRFLLPARLQRSLSVAYSSLVWKKWKNRADSKTQEPATHAQPA